MNTTETFLRTFKDLEEKIISLSRIKAKYVSFSRALDECHKRKVTPLLGLDETYSILRSASDLRNILSHQNDICVPTDDFTKKFYRLAEEIIHPMSVYDIATKKSDIIYAKPTSLVLDIVNKMVEKHLSHVPVIERGQVIAVFSQSTFYQYLYANKELKCDETYHISDFIKEADYLSHLDETFIFVPVNQKAYTLMNYLYKKDCNEKRVSAIFVTQNGRDDEELLGMITQTDLLKIPSKI